MNEVDERFVNREEWLKARKSLLQKEKELTQARDALSAERRELPLVRVDTNYAFNTERGEENLSDLFKGSTQLIVYHFMFGADWEQGCVSCSYWMDNFNGIDKHLAARNTQFVVVSTAPLERLLDYKKRLGWQFDWVSSGESTFNQDFGVTFIDKEPGPSNGYNYTGKVFGSEMPGLSVFKRFDDDAIGHSYSSYSRGLDILNGAYHLLDTTPAGRDEDKLDSPMSWLKRNDEY